MPSPPIRMTVSRTWISISGSIPGRSPSFTTEPVTLWLSAAHLRRAVFGVAPGPLMPEPGFRLDGGRTGPGGLCGCWAAAYAQIRTAAAAARP